MAEKAKSTKKANRRTDAQLAAGSARDKVVLVARKGFNLAKANGYEGIAELQKVKFPRSTIYRVLRPGGPIYTAPEKAFEEVRSAAKSALPDISDMKYTASVRNFLVKALALTPPAGERGVSMASLKGLSL